jgi:DNA helicase-2/ATP-dependent DNA helicase PcrA
MSQFVLEGMQGPVVHRIDYQKELNQEQLDVVLHGDGACLVLAGAGSGKTRTLTYRVAYLLEQGINPSELLLLTFTNKAAREMLQRVGALMGQEAQGIWGGTFHSVGSRILRSFAESLGYQPNFSILDTEDANDLLKSVMKDLQLDPKTRRVPSASVAHSLLSYARNTQRSIEVCLQEKHPTFAPLLPEIEQLAAQYQQRKKAANAMDFDDLLSNMVILLEDPVIGATLAHSFKYVLVDEFQDTNALQARIVKGFAKVHQNILVVGDDAQSIYAFRGADVNNILSFPTQWPEAKTFKLLNNYRSTPEILEVANESLTHNEHQFEKELVGMSPSGKKPKVVPCSSATQEAQYVAEQVLALQKEGKTLSQMAVLFRSSAHSQALEFELLKRDLPYEYRGGQKFFERAHIKDVIAFLRVFGNVQDEVAWMRVLGLQTGIGATTAGNLAKQAMKATEFKVAISSPEMEARAGRGRTGWKEFVQIGEQIVLRAPYPASMIRAVCDSPYQQYLEREYPNWKERLEDLEQLASFAESYQELSRFLADISLYDDVVAARETGVTDERERLVLSTIHQAKGLEWDAVFVIHLVDTAFPNRRALAEEGGMEEERRLFYVAVTRARRELFLVYPLTMGYDALMFLQPSTFIEEVSPRLFERVQLVERRTSFGFGQAPKRPWEWNADSSWEEPTIERDPFGNTSSSSARTPTVWKKPGAASTKPPAQHY